MNYVPYHLHTKLSNGVTNIDSVSDYKDYVKLAKEWGMNALGFSEHGSVLEWVHKKNAIEAAGMKYIHAEEFYITESLDQENLIRDNYHCILIARNWAGVKELNKLSSKAFYRDGHFYYQSRITFEELFSTSNNIIITSACVAGVIGKADDALKREYIEFLWSNRNRCFLEIQHHPTKEQAIYNDYIYRIHKKTYIPLIAGTDSHSAIADGLTGRDIMQKSKSVSFGGEDGWDLLFRDYNGVVTKYEEQGVLSKDIYLKALDNTNQMADMVESFELDYSYKYPVLYKDSQSVFISKIKQGIIDRGIYKLPNFDEYKQRIKSELKTYVHNGAIDFMLLEEDYKRALREQGVVYGYSRGSVSGSLIAYLLHITDVDSVKYNLNFSRFMNSERVSLADIDTDWYDTDRDKVRDYLFNKEGLYCCNIVTFNTIKLRGAIKDVGRALGYTPEETQAICNQVTEDDNKNEIIDQRIIDQHKELFSYVDIVKGTITSLGRHAAGLVVSPIDVEEFFGTLTIASDPRPISQINMKEIDSLNFVKLDVLGLDGVGLISQTCNLAGIPYLTPDTIDYNDAAVWKDLSEDTTLVFQFESGYASNYLKEILKPETIENIRKINPNFSYIDLMSMANGAIRPAGASYRNELSHGIFHDNGNKELNDFLAPTLGFLVYQEQIIEFLYKFCGFTMGEADIVRRHFSKKTGTENDIPIIKNGGYMIEGGHYIKGFIQTMKDTYNVAVQDSEKIIENFLQVIIDASDYLFSYNHALPYSFIGYTIAWLKHYYPLETYTTALNIYQSDVQKMAQITLCALSKGIKIHDIQFGKSGATYTMDKENNAIYKGIESIKYCNAQIAEELFSISQNAHNDFVDLLIDIRNNVSKDSRALKILISLNFFSMFGGNKKLLTISEMFDNLSMRSQINKDDLEKLGLNELLIKRYSSKETKKQYREIDNIGLIKELASHIPDESLDLISQMKIEKEYLGYIASKYENVNEHYYVVTEFETYKDKMKPYLTVRHICSGQEKKTRIKRSDVFKNKQFEQWSILEIINFDLEFKKRSNAEGVWVVTDETEPVLNRYQIIKH